MPTKTPPKRVSLRRAAALVGGLAAFALLASVLEPMPSSAADRAAVEPMPLRANPHRAPTYPDNISQDVPSVGPMGGRLIGQLAGRDLTLLIYATDDGPRYTIADADGYVIARALTPEELAERFPSLNPANLEMDAGAEATGYVPTP